VAPRAEPSVSTFEALGRRLEYRWIGPRPGEAPTIVFLHQGLGSTGTWRDFPDRLASATGCGALVYSRTGHGRSEAVPGPRPVRYLHDEAFDVLPAVLERFGLRDVVVFGHSDGASIAILYAGSGLPIRPPRRSVRALILEAPHVFVEPVCLEGMARIKAEYGTTRLKERLSRHHGDNTDALFTSWSEVWLRPEFRSWNIEGALPAIESPVLVIQGEEDEYGTAKQVEAVVAGVRGPARSLLLAHCGHSPHRERAEEVLDAASRFVREVLNRAGQPV
jgi:pimeloyl-ACP methyl ester carboxylesterase